MTGAPRRGAVIAILCAAAAAAAMLSLAVGPAALSAPRIAAAFSGHGDPIASLILFHIRLPRVLLGLLVGAMLGLAGAALQGYLRNPLADPGVLGATNAAALGAVITLYFGFATLHPLLMPLAGIGGALVAFVLLFLLAGRAESGLTLILAGVAIFTAAGAGISLALNLAPNPFAAVEIMTWLVGSIEDRSLADVALAAPCVAIGAVLLLWDGRALDALTLGQDGARALGADLSRVQLRLLLGVAIGVGGVVAVSGSIGFVGLVVPHLVRPFTDRSPAAALVPSALAGAALLTLADVAVRLVPTTSELRLGVVTSLLGVPLFMALLLRERRLW